jgi:hypothetical protein
MNKLTKIKAGQYRHESGALIEKRGRERKGRTGYALAGWAIVVNGRETSRWSTRERAAEEAGR